MKEKHEKRVYQLWDVFPFGKYHGVTLSSLADYNAGHLEWWQKNNKVLFSDALQKKINDTKFLNN